MSKSEKIDKILLWTIIIIALVLTFLGGFIYLQKQKLVKIFSSQKSVNNIEDRAIVGDIINLGVGLVTVQTNNQGENIWYKIFITPSTKIYQDSSELGKASMLVGEKDLNIGNHVVVGLTGTKRDSTLTAEVIHILP